MSNGLFNSVFNHACPSLPFVPKGLKESIGSLLDSFNTFLNRACPSLPFVPKGLMDSKRCQMDPF